MLQSQIGEDQNNQSGHVFIENTSSAVLGNGMEYLNILSNQNPVDNLNKLANDFAEPSIKFFDSSQPGRTSESTSGNKCNFLRDTGFIFVDLRVRS